MVQAKTGVKGKLTGRHVVGYGLGDMGGCMTFALMGSMVTIYYVDVLRVNTVTLAALLLIWNVWDAVNDPMMGALMDKVFAKRRDPRGKFRPWMLRATPLLAVSAVVFWTVPTFFDGTAMLVVLFFCKVFYEGMYTMFNIPYGSLLSAMSDTDEERAKLSSSRGFGSMIGNMLPMMIMPALLGVFRDRQGTGLAVGAAICALLGFVMCLFSCRLTEERNVVETKEEGAQSIRFTDILGVFRNNRAFLALCVHGVCICTMQYVGSTLGAYMYKDVLGGVELMGIATALSMPLSIVFLFAAPKISKKLGLENMIRYGLLLGCALYVTLFLLHVTMRVNVWVHIIWSTAASGMASLSILMQWGLVGEAIDYNEYLTGKRTEGSIYGTFNLCRRIGQTVGNSAAVLLLGAIGYNAGAAVQSDGTVTGIKVLCVLLPGIFVLGSWASFKFIWNITPEIRAEMAAKKQQTTD